MFPPGYWTLCGVLAVVFVGVCVTAIEGNETRRALAKHGDVIVALAEEVARLKEGK
jgi:drug/metabolite transporter superfamily protein YnfA